MSKNRVIKEQKVQEIKDKFQNAKSAVLIDYLGLNVQQATELRSQFRQAGVEYKVYKNRLVKLAIEGTEYSKLTDELIGPNAIAFGYEDAVVALSIAKKFSKKNPKLELKSGVVEGEYYDSDKIKILADIPSRDVLIAKFMGSISSPISKFAYLVKAIADSRGEE